MQSPERISGILNEDERMKVRSTRNIVRAVRAIETIGSSLEFVSEPFPEDGSFIVVSDHAGLWSVFRTPGAVVRMGRLPDIVVKDTLLNPEKKESVKVLLATGKSGHEMFSSRDDLESEDLGVIARTKRKVVLWGRYKAAEYINGVANPIPVKREGADRREMVEMFDQVDKTLERGGALVVFGPWSRTGSNSLEQFKDLAAMIIMRNPETSVFPMVQVKRRYRRATSVVGMGFTLREIEESRGGSKMTRKQLTEFLMDDMEGLFLTKNINVEIKR